MSSPRPRAHVDANVLPEESIRIRVRAFALAAQMVGQNHLSRVLPPGATVGDLLGQLRAEFPRLAELGTRLRTAVGSDYVTDDRRLADGDEVVLIPPVTGG